MPSPGPVTFKEACRVLDDSLLSPSLSEHESVARLVQQLHLPSSSSVQPELQPDAGDPAAQPAWLERAADDTWQVLEVMRSAIGDWQTDAGEEHEAPAALGHALKASTDGGPGLQTSLSRKLTHGRPRRLSLRRHDSTGSQHSHGPDAPASLHRPWHLQEQGKLHRVLYRPGEEGTPFHTMLLEGIIRGSAGTALSVCWETPYYPQWWPQFSVPTFNVTESFVAADINRYHNLCVSRIKVSWPFATREIGVSSRLAFVDPITGTALVSISTMPEDPRRCSEALTGYAPEKIPGVPRGVVRLGVEGGYLIQRLTADTCYFRAFSTVDMRVDVVPVWLVNFINRTLAGTGFQLLSQVVKDVVSKKQGIGTTFQELLSADDSIFKQVDAILNTPPPPGAQSEQLLGGEAQDSSSREIQPAAGDHPRLPDLEGRHPEPRPALSAAVGVSNLASSSLASRDQELSEALCFLDEVICQVKADTLSMYSEVQGRSVQGAYAAANGKGSEVGLGSASGEAVGAGRKGKRRWWRKLRLGKMGAVRE